MQRARALSARTCPAAAVGERRASSAPARAASPVAGDSATATTASGGSRRWGRLQRLFGRRWAPNSPPVVVAVAPGPGLASAFPGWLRHLRFRLDRRLVASHQLRRHALRYTPGTPVENTGLRSPGSGLLVLNQSSIGLLSNRRGQVRAPAPTRSSGHDCAHRKALSFSCWRRKARAASRPGRGCWRGSPDRPGHVGPAPHRGVVVRAPSRERKRCARAVTERASVRGQRFEPSQQLFIGCQVHKQHAGAHRREILQDSADAGSAAS